MNPGKRAKQGIWFCAILLNCVAAVFVNSTPMAKSRGSYKDSVLGFHGGARAPRNGHFDRLSSFESSSIFKNVFRSGQPDYTNPESIKALRENGIKVVFNLRAEASADRIEKERKALAAAGIELVHLPMDTQVNSNKNVNSPEKTYEALLKLKQLIEDQPQSGILVHCLHGEDRTGIMIRLLRELNGEDPKKTAQDFSNYGGTLYAPLKKLYSSVIEISEKRQSDAHTLDEQNPASPKGEPSHR